MFPEKLIRLPRLPLRPLSVLRGQHGTGSIEFDRLGDAARLSFRLHFRLRGGAFLEGWFPTLGDAEAQAQLLAGLPNRFIPRRAAVAGSPEGTFGT
jgi:hypothetical protein